MPEQAEGTTTINASAREIMRVITDFDAYPEWTGFTSAQVLKRDNRGHGSEVRYHMKAPLIGDVDVVLSYRYRARDRGCSWSSKEIVGAMERITGEYILEELNEDETRVTYRTSVDLKLRVPGMLKRQGEKQIIRQALDGLKKRVEEG
jgi:ribosome-associated toxin RatA of RatAB toxin-antitoxin module